MRHNIATGIATEEEGESVDPQQQALQDMLQVLLPIRQRRLRRSQQQQRKQEQALVQQQRILQQGEQQLLVQRQQYQQSQSDFADRYTGTVHAQWEVQQGLEDEQSHRQQMLQQQSHTQQLSQQVTAQQENLTRAKQDVQLCQRAVEKVEYLLQQRGEI